jgi:EAL domain-containing protein (putative c-di-GMP-specific phosphodiesterase class I)
VSEARRLRHVRLLMIRMMMPPTVLTTIVLSVQVAHAGDAHEGLLLAIEQVAVVVLIGCSAQLLFACFSECRAAREAKRERSAVISLSDSCDFRMVFQPIVRISDNTTIGHEALARFANGAPEAWFRRAVAAGLGTELECAAITQALDQLHAVPPQQYLAVNVSPQTMLTPQFLDVLFRYDLRRVVLEITEHRPVDVEQAEFVRVIGLLRHHGARFAVDDIGSAYSSLRNVLHLSPEIVKLDYDVVHSIERDPVRRTLVTSLALFTNTTASVLVAEGVETTGELRALQAAGVPCAQGWLLGAPTTVPRSAEQRYAETRVREFGHPST